MPRASTDRLPRRRPWHATAELDSFAITTWAVSPGRLAAILPDGFEPELFDLDGDGGASHALVSSVSFRNDSFRFRGAPFVRMSCGQIDHRTYVRCNGEPGVWFLGMSMDHPLATVGTLLWSMPWHHEHIDIAASWDGAHCAAMTVTGTGDWGETSIDLDGAAPPHPAEVLRSPLLTDQMRCWYPRIDGGIGRYTVWHETLELQAVTVRHARSRPFEAMELVDVGQEPLGALVVRSTPFDIHTPPTLVRKGAR